MTDEMSAAPDSFTRIALNTLVREIDSMLDAERRPFENGGQHHNGPRRISIELDIGRAKKIRDWASRSSLPVSATTPPEENP